MATYIFRLVVEPDEGSWYAYCPALLTQGGATWGRTKEEALQRIHEVVTLVVESLIEHGEPIPDGLEEEMQLSSEDKVAVTI